MKEAQEIPIKNSTNLYAKILWGVLILGGIYLTSFYSYPLFHSLAEIFSFVIAFCIFLFAWNARRFVSNQYFIFIGIAYFFVGSIDMIHTLAYPGMGVFLGRDTNLPTQLWISARYLESLSFLIAPYFVNRTVRANTILAGFTVVTLLLLSAIFYWHLFPACYIEGTGLTPFKKISEFIIAFILFASILSLTKQRKYFSPSVLKLLVAAIIITIISELIFTLYANAYDLYNMFGHLLKILSFYLLYKAIIQTSLFKPYDSLFLELKKSEQTVLSQ